MRRAVNSRHLRVRNLNSQIMVTLFGIVGIGGELEVDVLEPRAGDLEVSRKSQDASYISLGTAPLSARAPLLPEAVAGQRL